MSRKVVFAPEAEDDLSGLYDYIAIRSGGKRAIGYIGRIETYCLGLEDVSERGRRRDDLLYGLRTIGFERRIAIAFIVDTGTVTILRVLYAGRDLNIAFGHD